MQVKLLGNLGLDDARKCNKEFGTSLPVVASELTAGKVIELTNEAVTYLARRYRGAKGLIEEVNGVARTPAIKGVRDNDKQ